MRISPAEEYGLRCILKLAKGFPHKLVTVEDIAQQEGISAAYVEKLLLQLKKAGLVISTRGASGGFSLSKDPTDIPLGRVLLALDKTMLTEVAELCERFPGEQETCVHLQGCNIRPLWVVLANHFYKILNQVSLKDLMRETENSIHSELTQRLPVQIESPLKHMILS